MKINIGRKAYGGVFNGLFGNPVRQKEVSEQYRTYFRELLITNRPEVDWLKDELDRGSILYCPGCGIGSPTCHGRIIEQEINKLANNED